MNQASVIALSVSIIVASVILLTPPVFLKLRYGAYLKVFLAGAASYALFALILENLVGAAVIPLLEDGGASYIVYTVLSAGLFEETARFMAMRYVVRDDLHQGLSTPLMYGAGHAGAEAVIAGIGMFSTLTVMLLLSSSGIDGAMATLSTPDMSAGDIAGLKTALEGLMGAPMSNYLAPGADRALAFVFHASASTAVWLAATGKGPLWLYPAAIGLHCLYALPSRLYECGVVSSVWAAEALTALFAAAAVAAAFYAWRKWGEGPLQRHTRREEFSGYRLG